MSVPWRRAFAGLFLFGISFGFVEAAVVVYLRHLYEPIRRQIHPGIATTAVFPITRPQQVIEVAPWTRPLIRTEVMREAATLIMVLSAGLCASAGASRSVWLPGAMIAMGVWDISFYVSLRLLIGWPESLLTWDLLFLIPAPWAAPVIAPILVSLSLIIPGMIAYRRPVRLRAIHSLGAILGCLVILVSFMWDVKNVQAGGFPGPFPWAIFAAGELIGVASFVHALRTTDEHAR